MSLSLNIDLHTHSNYSDGTWSPAALIERAAAAGVEVLALTDHDTVAGLDEAQQAATERGLRLVPGVEISAAWRSQAVHVLGLWIDPASPELRGMLHAQGELRRVRMRKICARLEKLRLPGAELLAAVESNPGLPTRAHLAAALVAGGHVDTHEAAFRKYLSKGKAAHIAAQWPTLEAVTGGNGDQHVDTCAALAVKHGLFGSVGSDFHSPQAAWNPLGRSLKLPDCVTPVWRSFGL